MANERSKDKTVNLGGGGNITLDQLVSATSSSVLRALREHQGERAGGGFQINPRIWVGIWIDLEQFKGPIGGPGGGPIGGGGVG